MALCGRGEINNLSFQNLYRDITVSPSGDKTSPLLFAILVNNLVKDWETRVKYVDDLSVLAGVILDIIPRCSTSMLPFIARDIFSYASSHGVKLNPSKCKSYA